MKPEDQKAVLVIDKYLNQHDNTVPTIAKQLDLQPQTVHKIINNYLKELTINE